MISHTEHQLVWQFEKAPKSRINFGSTYGRKLALAALTP